MTGIYNFNNLMTACLTGNVKRSGWANTWGSKNVRAGFVQPRVPRVGLENEIKLIVLATSGIPEPFGT